MVGWGLCSTLISLMGGWSSFLRAALGIVFLPLVDVFNPKCSV